MPMISCEVELKRKWRKHCVLATACVETNNAISNSIFLLLKAQHYMSLLSLYQQKTIKNYQNFLAKGLKDLFIGMNIKKWE